MGCGNSKDVAVRIEKQEKKIDELIKMNADLENKFRDLLNTMRNPHGGNESTNDLSHLKSMIDTRFNHLESHVRRIHNDFRLKLFDGIEDNLEKKVIYPEKENGQQKNDVDKLDASLSLPSIHDAYEEKGDAENAHWKDILEESPTSQASNHKVQGQYLVGVKRSAMDSKKKIEILNSQDSIKESSAAKLARVQEKEGSGAQLARVQDKTQPKEKSQEVHERLGEGEGLAKGHFLITGTTKSMRKYPETSSSQFKQQHLETLKSKELNTEVLNPLEIKMEVGETERLKSAADTGKSKKSMQLNAEDLIPEKGKEIYNDVLTKMFKNSGTKPQ